MILQYSHKPLKYRYVEFNVHGSVHRNNILIYIQQDATLHSLFQLETALHVSGGTTTHHQEHNSTCFGRPHAHHQEFNKCSSSLWFYLRSVVIAVLLAMVGLAGYHYYMKVKPEAATAVVELLMMGVRTPKTC
jgi:hypothetical protein